MRYIVDNDLHIHSRLSLCSGDENQTPQAILDYAEKNGLKTICITDHFWDEAIDGATVWYGKQNYSHICESKPLPQKDGIRFLFGCETELHKTLTLALSKEKMDLFDFIIIPTTHMHMSDFAIYPSEVATVEARVNTWIKRFDNILERDLPFHKIGLAHLTCRLITKEWQDFYDTIAALPEDEMRRLFTKAAQLGVGIELNADDVKYADEYVDVLFKPYRIAKECGCKFYLGSDAHKNKELDKGVAVFERAVDILGLTEDDKFRI